MPAAQLYFAQSLSSSSSKSYKSAQSRYEKFCHQFSLVPYPLSETLLCSFASFLAQDGLKVQSIKCYLSALRYAQIANGFPDPRIGSDHPRLECILRGIKRSQASANPPARSRLPITPDILSSIRLHLPHSPDSPMIWAACCLAFFGFLRAGEFTVPSRAEFDPEVHLSLADLALDSHSSPSLMRIRIKQSKTDPFRHGVDIYLGKVASPLCPISAMIAYVSSRGPQQGPLFLFSDGSTLSRQRLVSAVRDCLSRAGLREDLYAGHSFRIGAATTAAKKGLEDSMIQTLGRWQSSAYLRYIHISRSSLASVSQLLAS